MRDLLFDAPWYLIALLAVVGFGLLLNGNRRQNARIRSAGLIVLLLAIAWAAVSYLVDTPKEICLKQTRHLVQAVVDRNWTAFDGLVSPDVDFKFVGSSWQMDGKDPLTSAVKANADQIGLKSATITDARAAEAGNTITVTIRVFSNQDLSLDRPVDSDWEMDWREAHGKWLLHEIRAIQVTGVSPEQVHGSLRIH